MVRVRTVVVLMVIGALVMSCGSGKKKEPAQSSRPLLEASALPAGFHATAARQVADATIGKLASDIGIGACGDFGSQAETFANADGTVFLSARVKTFGSPGDASQAMSKIGDASCLKTGIHDEGFDAQVSDGPSAPAAGDEQKTAQRLVIDPKGKVTPAGDTVHVADIQIYLARKGTSVYSLFVISKGIEPVAPDVATGALQHMAGTGTVNAPSGSTTSAPSTGGSSVSVGGSPLVLSSAATCDGASGAVAQGELDGAEVSFSVTPNEPLASGADITVSQSNALRFTLTVTGGDLAGNWLAQGLVGSGHLVVGDGGATWTVDAVLWKSATKSAGTITVTAKFTDCNAGTG